MKTPTYLPSKQEKEMQKILSYATQLELTIIHSSAYTLTQEGVSPAVKEKMVQQIKDAVASAKERMESLEK